MKKLILGNIITIDPSNPKAQAIVVNNGKIEYVGNKEEAIKLCGSEKEVLDYSNNYIYPGFIEPHCHGVFAGYRAVGQANLPVDRIDYDEYSQIIKKYIEDYPNKQYYLIAGWNEDERELDHTFLDDIYNEKPVIMNSAGGHSCLLNTKAIELLKVNKDVVKEYGVERVHVDKDGNPTGYICEEAAVKLLKILAPNYEEAIEYALAWQDIALSKGYTACGDAGAELIYTDSPKVYADLEKQNKLKLRTYSYSLIQDNEENASKAVEEILEKKKQLDGEYFKTIGAKVFLDGVSEARTSWTVDDYDDEKGYTGVRRFNNEERMINLINECSKYNLPVHAHSEGDGATRFFLNCIKKSQETTHNLDQRNVVAHLHYVQKEDFENMAKTGSIAAVAPLWTAKFPGAYEKEVASFGQKRADSSYPIKSFIDAGATIVFHSDYPISPILDISRSIYKASLRALPEKELGGMATQRGKEECISRIDSLKALTINGAYCLKQEKIMGSIEKNKLANFAVFDSNFLDDDLETIIKAKHIATIVDGNAVTK